MITIDIKELFEIFKDCKLQLYDTGQLRLINKERNLIAHGYTFSDCVGNFLKREVAGDNKMLSPPPLKHETPGNRPKPTPKPPKSYRMKEGSSKRMYG